MKTIINIDPRIMGKKSELLEQPVVILVNEFTEESAKKFAEAMQRAHEAGQPVIPVVIDSYGGMVDSLLHMISEIDSSEIPVATICQGKAMSCGSVLLSCGEENHRFIDPISRVMIHDVSNMTWGKCKNEEIKSNAAETDRLNKLIFRRMSQNCDQPRDYFLDLIHEKAHAEWYLTAQQARRHNIVNHVRVPTMTVNVNVEMAFE